MAIISIDNPCEGPVPNDSSAEPRMIGDFDDNTNKLWSLYGEEAESHDKVRIKYLKEDMDGVLIFVRPYFTRARSRVSYADTYLHRLVYSQVH